MSESQIAAAADRFAVLTGAPIATARAIAEAEARFAAAILSQEGVEQARAEMRAAVYAWVDSQ